LSLPITLRAERSVLGLELGIRLGTGDGMGAAGEQAKGKGGGGGGGGPTAPPLRAYRRGLGGTTPRPHC